MALSDPQSVTINAVANSLPRVLSGPGALSKYQKDDANGALTVAHTYGKRTRSQVRLDFRKVAPDPLISAQNIYYSMSAYLVVDRPITGFTITEAKQIVDALTAWLTASSGANVTKVLGGEN